MTILRLDHVGVVAHSLDEATDVLVDRLGLALDRKRTPLAEGGFFAPENARIWFVAIGEGQTAIEILIPQDRVTGMGRYLAKKGPGFHHLCYASDNLDEDARLLSDRGLERIALPPESRAAFFYPRSVLGILTELIADRGDRLHSAASAQRAAGS